MSTEKINSIANEVSEEVLNEIPGGMRQSLEVSVGLCDNGGSFTCTGQYD